MLLAYDKISGKVVWNSGTSTLYPDGPPDEVAYTATNTTVGLLRLNDTRDANLIALVFTKPVSVKNGQLVVDNTSYTPAPPPEGSEPPPPPLPLEQRLAGMQDQIDQLRELVMLATLGGPQ